MTMISTIAPDLMQRQRELEEEMQGLGAVQYRKSVERAQKSGREAGTRYGHALVKHNLERVSAAIGEFLAEAFSGKPGPKHTAVKYLKDMDHWVVALHTLRVLMDGVSNRRMIQNVAMVLADRLEDEAKWTALEEEHSHTFKKVEKQLRKVNSDGHKGRILDTVMYRKDMNWTAWPHTDKAHLGLKMIDLAINSTGLFERYHVRQGKNDSVIYIVATEKLAEWIDNKNERMEMLTALHLPCVIPPKDWTTPFNGGYHTDAVPRYPLVKTRNSAYLEELANRADEMPTVYDTINALQRTAWKINTPVLEVMDCLWDRDIGVAKMPMREDVQHVPCPTCGTPLRLKEKHEDHSCFAGEEPRYRPLRQKISKLKDTDKDREEKAQLQAELGGFTIHRWKKAAAIQHEKNASNTARRIQFLRTLDVAHRFQNDAAIYMPYQFDFRGRVYAVPTLNPQGPDQMKGLLTFAEGLPINDEVAAGWLAIQGANVWGEDKVSLADRIAWVEHNEDRILATAADPLADLWWTEADKPWQFLAWVFEWAGFQNEGWGYVSHLPVALDGSCSGIQHFSAMLRDGVGGEAVNLLPANRPADIYQRVWDIVEEKLRLVICNPASVPKKPGEPHGEEDQQWAQYILALGGSRKATKRQVMTLPYGAKASSCRSYTEEWIVETLEDRRKRDPEFPFPAYKGKEWNALVTFLSGLIWYSIGEVVIAARDAMDWLQSCASVVAAEELPIIWTTPAGLPIQQLYHKTEGTRIKTKIGDVRVDLTLHDNTKATEVDVARMRTAMAPNFVHSMDAAHLMLSVSLARDNGVRHFAMIHDSFGTHAANTELFGQALRMTFVDMYEDHDVLTEFRDSVKAMVSPERQDKLKGLPMKGALDLALVEKSDFFFA